MKYIIFDIDGTLTNTTKVDDKCYIESFESLFNTSIKDVQWHHLKNVTDWGITEELIKLKLEREATQNDIGSLKQIFLNKIKEEFNSNRSNFNEIEGARRFYKLVNEVRHMQTGIATGGWEETATFKLNKIGVDPTLVSYSNSNYFKEREKIILDVIDKLNSISPTKPEEIIYFGDGEWDLKTCKNLGIRFIGIDSKNNGKLMNLGAKEVYSDFKCPEKIMNSILQS